MYKAQTGAAQFSTGEPAPTVALVAPQKTSAGQTGTNGITITGSTVDGEDADWRTSFSKRFTACNSSNTARPMVVRGGRPVPPLVRALSSQYAGVIAKLLLVLLAVADAVRRV